MQYALQGMHLQGIYSRYNGEGDIAQAAACLKPHGTSGKAQVTLVATADALEEKGHSASLLRDGGGSGKAQSMVQMR